MYLSAGITLLLVASLSGTLALSENAEHQLAHNRVLRQSNYGACSTECPDLSEPIRGTLNIHVKNAKGLPDTDGAFQGRSDPFALVTAFNYASSISKSTGVVTGSHDPVWDETLSFGFDVWKSITIGVLDSDCGRDEILIPFESFPICSTGRCSVNYQSGSSRFNFDIEVIPNHI